MNFLTKFTLALILATPSASVLAKYAGILPVAQDPKTKKAVVLMQIRHSGNQWGDFGGLVNPGESLRDGARREGLEELMIEAPLSKGKKWVNPHRLYRVKKTFDPAFKKAHRLHAINTLTKNVPPHERAVEIYLVRLPYIAATHWNKQLAQLKRTAGVPRAATEVVRYEWIELDELIRTIENNIKNPRRVAGLSKCDGVWRPLFSGTYVALKNNLSTVKKVRASIR